LDEGKLLHVTNYALAVLSFVEEEDEEDDEAEESLDDFVSFVSVVDDFVSSVFLLLESLAPFLP